MMRSRLLHWASRLLLAATVLFGLSWLEGLVLVITGWVIIPLFILSGLLYAMALGQAELGTLRQWLAAGWAWFTAGTSLFLVAGGPYFRWLLLGWAAAALVVGWLLWQRQARHYWVAAAVLLSCGGLTWVSLATTSLRLPIEENDRFWAETILWFGADANGTFVRTPVMCDAINTHQAAWVALLLQHGADPNARDNRWASRMDRPADTPPYTQTPVLFDAIMTKEPRLVNMLLAAGANPLLTDYAGRNSLHIARSWTYPDSATLQRAALRFGTSHSD